jgi:hypothetical protein
MKSIARAQILRALSILLLLVGLIGAPAAKADILRLRDGRMFTGQFLGATKDQIWFETDAPGNALGPSAFSIVQVESLTFGPDPKQSNATGAALVWPPERKCAADQAFAVPLKFLRQP